jgi:hypothetical protein
MANTIKLKSSVVAGKSPTTSDIAAGESAVNHTDKKLYFRNPSTDEIWNLSSGGGGGLSGTGSTDNAILRADGTGGATLQNSDIVIDDATTSTQANVALVNNHSETNSALVLTPKGTGAFILGPKPDGTVTGGNARGNYAVDLQVQKNSNAHAATGSNSVLCGGRNSTASGQYSFLGSGYSNIASGANSVVCGGGVTGPNQGNTASGLSAGIVAGSLNTASARAAGVLTGIKSLADRYAMQAHAAGQFAATGDAQRARFVLRNKTTDATPTELFLDGASARLTIPSGKIFAFTINISGVKSDGSAVAHYLRQYALKNVAGTTSEVYAPVTIGTDNPAGTSIALSANDTNDALKVEVTGIAAETWRWVASVDAVEIAYGA